MTCVTLWLTSLMANNPAIANPAAFEADEILHVDECGITCIQGDRQFFFPMHRILQMDSPKEALEP